MRVETVPILLTFADGSVGIMQFVTRQYQADGRLAWARNPAHGAVQAEIEKGRFAPPVRSWRAIAQEDIPADRTYRNAWIETEGGIGHDMGKARARHREVIRLQRAAVLIELDAQWMQAMGRGDHAEAQDIDALRQAWRDAPADPSIDAATTIEDLKRIGVPHREHMTFARAIKQAFKQLREPS